MEWEDEDDETIFGGFRDPFRGDSDSSAVSGDTSVAGAHPWYGCAGVGFVGGGGGCGWDVGVGDPVLPVLADCGGRFAARVLAGGGY